MSGIAGANPITRSFWRLVWKEVRQYCGLVLILLVAGLLLQAGGLAFQFGSLTVLLAASVIPVMCGLALAATTFAGEHDNATYLGLRVLPATGNEILAAKLLVATGSAFTVFLALWLVIAIFHDHLVGSGKFIMGEAEVGEWLIGSLAMVLEALVYGALVSLAERNALVAVAKSLGLLFLVRIGSTVLAYFGLAIGGWLFDFDLLGTQSFSMAMQVGSYLIRTSFLVAGLLLVPRAMQRWYAGETRASGWLRWGWSEQTLPRIVSSTHCGPGAWRRLQWLQLRYYGWIAGMILVASLAFLVWFRWETPSETARANSSSFRPELFFAVTAVASTVLGSLVFRAAQARKNFLASFGVAAWRVWLSQFLLPLLAVGSLIAVETLWLPNDIWDSDEVVWPVSWPGKLVWEWGSYLLVVFSWAQLCSQQARSVLSGLAWSILAATLAGIAWHFLSLLGFWSPACQFTGCIVLITYPWIESWLRAPAWLAGFAGHHGRWVAIRLAAIGMLSAGLLWKFETEIPYHSNVQIAKAINGGLPPDTSHFDEILAIAMRLHERDKAFRHAAAADPLFRGTDAELRRMIAASWYDACEEDLNRLLDLPYENIDAQALLRFANRPPSFQHIVAIRGLRSRFQGYFVVALERAIAAQNVELAERIIRKEPWGVPPDLIALWAWLADNDSTRIRDLTDFLHNESSPELAAIANSFASRVWATSNQPSYPFLTNPKEWLEEILLLPRGNREWRQRVVDFPLEIAEVRQELEQGQSYYQMVAAGAVKGRTSRWTEAVPTNAMQRRSYLSFLCAQRMVATQLAAIAWLRDHPDRSFESLDQLVPEYLPAIPRDPFTGEAIIFECDQTIPLRVWDDPNAKPTTTTDRFLYSPGWYGIQLLCCLADEFRKNSPDSARMPELTWLYVPPNFQFRLLNGPGNSQPKSTGPTDPFALVYPITLRTLD